MQQLGNAANYDPYGNQYQNPPQAIQPIPAGYQVQSKVQTPNMGSPIPQDMGQTPVGDLSFLAGKRRFFIKQRFEMIEAIANMVGLGVIEYSNKYDMFDADTGEPLLFAAEESNCFCRGLCKPNHPAKLHVFDVRPGVGQVPLFTTEKPFTCNLCTCHPICAQSQKTTMKGSEELLGSATKHVPCGGCFTPQIDVKDKLGNDELTIRGPCFIIGGLIELFRDQEFKLYKGGVQNGRIVKMKPQKGGDTMMEATGDADRYLFEMDAGLDAGKTANLLGTLLLLDYMFFEGGAPISFAGGKVHINCFNCYCGGCSCPCVCELGGNSNQGGGGFGGF